MQAAKFQAVRLQEEMTMKRTTWLIALAALALISGCTVGAPPAQPETPAAVETLADVTPEPGSLNLLATVLADDELSVLGDALVAAGLGPEMEAETGFTLLAPTNDAFQALPDAVLEQLLADPVMLADVLRYHLIVGPVAAADLAALSSALSVQGEPLAVALSADANLTVNDAQVVTADIPAANGVIHKIDGVLLPTTAQPLLAAAATPATPAPVEPVTVTEGITSAEITSTEPALLPTTTPTPGTAETSPVTSPVTSTVTTVTTTVTTTAVTTPTAATTATIPLTGGEAITAITIVSTTAPEGQTIGDVLAARPELSTLATAVATGGLDEALIAPGPFTFFAPTNAAFERVDPTELETLLNDTPRLARTLQYHVIADLATAQELVRLGTALTTMGQTVAITVDENGQVLANGLPILESIETANGIVLVLDGILIPADE
jgi:uncharacterized surface protein with fasciclin (FAS1) repeats